MFEHVVVGPPTKFGEPHSSKPIRIVFSPSAVQSDGPIKTEILRHTHLGRWHYRIVKRGIDFVCASLLIGLLALPGVLIATAICLDSEGSVFYREERVGRGKLTFQIWKFRSMRRSSSSGTVILSNSPDGTSLDRTINKDINDGRVTTIGRFLRQWSLDELPQLINVVRGEMSLVGPRPVIQEELPLYGELHEASLANIPGMSGLWRCVVSALDSISKSAVGLQTGSGSGILGSRYLNPYQDIFPSLSFRPSCSRSRSAWHWRW